MIIDFTGAFKKARAMERNAIKLANMEGLSLLTEHHVIIGQENDIPYLKVIFTFKHPAMYHDNDPISRRVSIMILLQQHSTSMLEHKLQSEYRPRHAESWYGDIVDLT